MNHSRFKAAMEGCSALSRKVYDAVPLLTPFTPSEVIAELQRLGATSVRDRRTIEGCLAQLQESGLISSSGRGPVRTYLRVAVTEARERPAPKSPEPKPKPQEVQEMAPDTAKKTAQPVDRISAACAQLRTLGANLKATAASLEDAAKQMEDAALDAEQDSQDLKAQLVKFQALQQALSALGALQAAR